MKLAAIVLMAACVTAAADDVTATVQKVADRERQLPWFWSPILEGLLDMPYTFRMTETRRFLDKQERESHAGTAMQLERIPLEGGNYFRCLMQNGAAPYSPGVVSALEADSHKAANFTAEEKVRARAAGEERRLRRRAFWTDFPSAFRFEQTGEAEIRFTPTGKYRPQREPNTDLLARIKGSFRFDPATFEITGMEYEMLADAETIGRLYKGSRFAVTLAALVDHHYLPVKVDIARKLPKGGREDAGAEYANYQRFGADSSLSFGDKQ